MAILIKSSLFVFLSLGKIDKSGDSMKSYFPTILRIFFLDRIKLKAQTIPHFEGLDMRNLQHKMRKSQKHHNKVTMTMSIECQFF